MMKIILIAALTQQRVIGQNGSIPWKIPEDIKHFKDKTMGHPVVMGRKTWESLPPKFRPLPERTNFVITRQSEYVADDATVAHSLEDALQYAEDAEGGDKVFVIGGGEIYQKAMPLATHLILTVVLEEYEGDAFFPSYDTWRYTFRSRYFDDQKPGYYFATLVRA